MAVDRPDPNLGSELRRQFRREDLVKREVDRALRGANTELAAEVRASAHRTNVIMPRK